MEEQNIIKLIETTNQMINIICEELNKSDNFDDYEIELDELNYTCCSDKKHQKNYKMYVVCKKED